jgi:hypothetical protein
MKRFLRKCALLVGFHLALFSVVLVSYVKRFPPEQSFYAGSLDKHELLARRASPRMIFLGGSSMALGMDTAAVARPLGYNPVNMGMNIGLGLELMIEEARPRLRSGDVVIVGAEYHTFQNYYRANSEYLARLVECRPSLLAHMTFHQWKSLLDRGYLQHLGLIYRIIANLRPSGSPLDTLTNECNVRSAFNENGDIVAHHDAPPKGGSSLRFEYKSQAQAEVAISHLNRFHEECRRRNVKVFFTHAPYERRFFDLYRPSIDRLEALLRAKLTIPMLDTPEELTFSKEEIYDVEYHLNLRGKIRRSKFVAERLRQKLAVP